MSRDFLRPSMYFSRPRMPFVATRAGEGGGSPSGFHSSVPFLQLSIKFQQQSMKWRASNPVFAWVPCWHPF